MIKYIIFDFGGVVLKHKASLMEEILSQIFDILLEEAEEIWKKERLLVMAGKISSREFLKRLKDELHSNKPLSEILKLWHEIYQKRAEEVDWRLLKFIKKLKRKYPVYLLTDTIDINDEYNKKRGIYENFTRVFKSNEEGFTKHTDEAFLNVLRKINTKAQECIFIDDLEINVKRAKDLGFNVSLYKGRDDLITKLTKLGVEISSDRVY